MTKAGWRSAVFVENKTILKVLMTQLARRMRALITTENTIDVPDDLYQTSTYLTLLRNARLYTTVLTDDLTYDQYLG
jgi:hypothetical protein